VRRWPLATWPAAPNWLGKSVPDQTAPPTAAALRSLIDRNGPPLVLKSDNGSAFKSERFGKLLARARDRLAAEGLSQFSSDENGTVPFAGLDATMPGMKRPSVQQDRGEIVSERGDSFDPKNENHQRRVHRQAVRRALLDGCL
jgi:hypothetical protein